VGDNFTGRRVVANREDGSGEPFVECTRPRADLSLSARDATTGKWALSGGLWRLSPQGGEEGRSLLAEMDVEGKVVWRLTRDQVGDQIEGSRRRRSGVEEMRITNVHSYDSERVGRGVECDSIKSSLRI